MKSRNGFVAIVLALSVAFGGALACNDKGPLEKAGDKIDETMDDITHPGEGPIEKAGRKVGEKMDDVEDDIND
jgi:hypothetical protein